MYPGRGKEKWSGRCMLQLEIRCGRSRLYLSLRDWNDLARSAGPFQGRRTFQLEVFDLARSGPWPMLITTVLPSRRSSKLEGFVLKCFR